MIYLKIVNASGDILASTEGYNIDFTYDNEYAKGDKFIIKLKDCEYVKIKLDETLEESIVYAPYKTVEFEIPFEDFGKNYAEDAFGGSKHRILISEPENEEIYKTMNIALNPYDRYDNTTYYPHASANFVTRGEACFRERNAIDGVIHNEAHGWFPYHSWSGGAREDVSFRIDFGQNIEIEKLIFFLRADFPHDSYWKNLTVEFSDKSVLRCSFEETADGQEVVLEEKKTTKYIILKDFKQAVYPLTFAALTQIQVIGNYIERENGKMEIRNASNSKDVKHYTTERLREEFHISSLFTKDNVRLVYSHIDRIITGGLMPVFQELRLEAGKELAADYFLQRREMGCINIGGKGIITIDGTEYELNPRDGIYIGMGNKEITFKSVSSDEPAKFYMSSCPAHKEYPIVKIDISKAKKVPCGSSEDANKRVINQYIHPEVIKSCQLAMGLTQLEPGSVWNTMPCHTHDRRMEVYLYLDMNDEDVVFHMMGEPTETRHIVMRNEEAVISPSWSIHSGVGTKAYSFIWAMCGENQEFTDMDHIATNTLL